MLVNLYKSKTPLSLLSYPLLVAVCASLIFFKTPHQEVAFFSWQQELFEMISNEPIISYLLVCLTLWISGVRLNHIVNRFDFYSKNTYLPGVVFLILVLCLGNLQMNSEKVSLLFIILGFEQALVVNRQESAILHTFVSSLFFGIATVMLPTVFPIVFLSWSALAIFRSFVWKEWFMLILGVLIPWMYNYGLYYFITGNWFMEFKLIRFTDFHFDLSIYEIILLTFALFIGLVGLVNYVISAGTGLLIFKKRSRFLYNAIVFSVIGTFISFIFFNEVHAAYMVPMAIVIAVYLLNMKSNVLANILLLGLGGMAAITYILS